MVAGRRKLNVTEKQLILVAHRGYPNAFPENSLLGCQQAVICGAQYIELDVQCTKDLVPILYHDPDTKRLSGESGSVLNQTYEQLSRLSAHHPQRFATRFAGTPVSMLISFSHWLADNPGITAFIEIKDQSLKEFGIDTVMQRVMQALEGAEEQCIIISFNDACVEHIRNKYNQRIGWVLPYWSEFAENRARELAPEFLFVDQDILPKGADRMWSGPWEWAVYVIDDIDEAYEFQNKGIRFVETDNIGIMLEEKAEGI